MNPDSSDQARKGHNAAITAAMSPAQRSEGGTSGSIRCSFQGCNADSTGTFTVELSFVGKIDVELCRPHHEQTDFGVFSLTDPVKWPQWPQ